MNTVVIPFVRALIVEIRTLFLVEKGVSCEFDSNPIYKCKHCGHVHKGKFTIDGNAVDVCPVKMVIKFYGAVSINLNPKERVKGYKRGWDVIVQDVPDHKVCDGQCKALTKSGERCKNAAIENHPYCHVHEHNGSATRVKGNRIIGQVSGMGF